MISTADIAAALRTQLPTELHGCIEPLAEVLTEVYLGQLSPAEANKRLAAEISVGEIQSAVSPGGDFIVVGNISDSKGVAIGRNAVAVNITLQGSSAELQAAQREQRLRAIVRSHSDLIGAKLSRFVGRVAELEEIKRRIAALSATGGYLIIQGRAGQGKSSILAAFVAQTLRSYAGRDAPQTRDSPTFAAMEREVGSKQLAHHFIPYEPGREYQINLLRDLNARLALKYDLSDFDADSTILPALKDYFANILRELHTRKICELIIIDGLDQIEPDFNGTRDLSFLPPELPPGVVIVIGTRPDDTLIELESKTPREPYELPDMSRADFVQILARTGRHLESALLQQFYDTMQQNALYLDLAARELSEQPDLSPEEMLERVAANPDNLFSFAINRLSRGGNEQRWKKITQHILGLLLAAREPLSELALRTLIDSTSRELRRSLNQLGGLLAQTSNNRRFLFHCKLRDYLREDLSQPKRDFVFDAIEEANYHQRLANWCNGGRGGLEAIWTDVPEDTLDQERRSYARQYYVTHLAAARAYEQLWEVIDRGEYGQMKQHWDPSARSYVLDLDIARQALLDSTVGDTDAQARALPKLWCYSLLRCELSNQADSYPETFFRALVALGRSSEAYGLAELLGDLVKKTNILRNLGVAMFDRNLPDALAVLHHASTTAEAITDDWERSNAQHALTEAFTKVGQFEEAHTIARTIPDEDKRDDALRALATALIDARKLEEAHIVAKEVTDYSHCSEILCALCTAFVQAEQFEQAHTIAMGVSRDYSHDEVLRDLCVALAQMGQFEQAEAIIANISFEFTHDEALSTLCIALAKAQRFEQARTIAEGLPDESRRNNVLSALALALAETENFEDAWVVVDAISEFGLLSLLHQLFEDFPQIGHYKQARGKAAAIKDKHGKAWVLSALAVALTRIGDISSAEEVFATVRALANETPNQTPDHDILKTLAKDLMQTKRFIQAQEVIENFYFYRDRDKALAELVVACIQNEELEQARTVFDTVIHPRWARGEFYLHDDELYSSLAENFADAMDFNRAKSVIDFISSIPKRRETWEFIIVAEEIAQFLAQMEQFEQLRTEIGKISDDFVLFLIGKKQFAQAYTMLTDICGRGYRIESLYKLGEFFILAGQFKLLSVVISAITNDEKRTGFLNALAETIIWSEKFEDICTTAAAISDSNERRNAFDTLLDILTNAELIDSNRQDRAEALSIMATAFAQKERFKEADQALAAARTAADVHNESERTTFLRTLAEYLIKAEQLDQAFVTAKSIASPHAQADVLSTLLKAFIDIRRWHDARNVAVSIPKDLERERDEALDALTNALIKAQCLDEARTLIDEFIDDGYRSAAQKELSTAFANAGQFELAHSIAMDITDDASQAYALAALAAILINVGQLKRAHDILQVAAHAAEDANPYEIGGFSDDIRALADTLANTDPCPDESTRAVILRNLIKVLSKEKKLGQPNYDNEEELDLSGDLVDEDVQTSLSTSTTALPHESVHLAVVDALEPELDDSNSLQLSITELYEHLNKEKTPDELLCLRHFDPAVFRDYPKLGEAFLDSFAWVDAQLAAI